MFSFSKSQHRRLSLSPISPTKLVQSVEPFSPTPNDNTNLSFTAASKLSFPSTTLQKPANKEFQQQYTGGHLIRNPKSTSQHLEKSSSPNIEHYNDTVRNLADNFNHQNQGPGELRVVHNGHQQGDRDENQTTQFSKSNIDNGMPDKIVKIVRDTNETTVHNHRSKFSLLNPKYLLARRRAPDTAVQCSHEDLKSNVGEPIFMTQEFESNVQDVIDHNLGVLDQPGEEYGFPRVGSLDENSLSSSSPDSMVTDLSSLATPLSEDISASVFTEKKGAGPNVTNNVLFHNFSEQSDTIETEAQELRIQPKIFESHLGMTQSLNERICDFINQTSIPKSNTEKLHITTSIQSLELKGPSENCFPLYSHLNEFYFDSDQMVIPQTRNDHGIFDDLVDMETKSYIFKPVMKCLPSSPLSSRSESFSISEISDVLNEKYDLDRLTGSPVDQSNLEDFTFEKPILNETSPEKEQRKIQLTEASLAAYQLALASATSSAAVNCRGFQEGITSLETLTSNRAACSKASLNENKSHNLLQEPESYFDDYEYGDDIDFGDDSQECDIIAEANAEALANDFDGFYGQEFGLYSYIDKSRNGRHSKNGNISRCVGLVRTRPGHNGHYALCEPSLTPITERSEHSNRNSYMSPSIKGPNSVREIASPGLHGTGFYSFEIGGL